MHMKMKDERKRPWFAHLCLRVAAPLLVQAGVIQRRGGPLVEEASLTRVYVWFCGAEHGQGPAGEQAVTHFSLGASASAPAAEFARDDNYHYCNQQQCTTPAEHDDDN